MQYKGKWKFWQHTDAGKLPGIKGYVDFNIYNGSYYDLRKLCIGSKGESLLEMMNMTKNMKKNKSFLLANLPKRKDFMI